MSVNIDITQREYLIANNVIRGSMSWEDLSFDDKLTLYRCPMRLEGAVTDEQLNSFEREIALKGELGVVRQVRETVLKAVQG